MSKTQSILLLAVAKLLRPLVRILLRHGIAYDDFAEIARKSYVTIAEQEFPPEGRKQSLTNIALVTGIHRHEVKKYLGTDSLEYSSAPQQHRVARVINGWISDAEFSKEGAAKTLDIATDFKHLVSKYSGDITPRPILDELLRVGAVEKTSDNALRLLVPAYVPQTSDEELIHIFGDSVSDLIGTLDYNLKSEPEERRMQLSVVYDNLPDGVISNLELICREKSLEFLNHLNQFFETQDRDSNPNVKGDGRNRAGIGLYFFQEPIDEQQTASSQAKL